MKNLITAIACLLILLAFVNQFFSNQIMHNKIARIEKDVYAFADITKHEGYVSTKNSENLKESISETLDCEANEISVWGTKEIKYRGENIDYNIKFPLKDLISAAPFWGFKGDVTSKYMTIKQSTVSEKLDRRI